MCNYVINKSMQMEVFSDGEIMLYDPTSENIHIFNQTAATVLSLIQENDFSDAKSIFISKFCNDKLTKKMLSNDFEQIIEDMLNKEILIKG